MMVAARNKAIGNFIIILLEHIVEYIVKKISVVVADFGGIHWIGTLAKSY